MSRSGNQEKRLKQENAALKKELKASKKRDRAVKTEEKRTQRNSNVVIISKYAFIFAFGVYFTLNLDKKYLFDQVISYFIIKELHGKDGWEKAAEIMRASFNWVVILVGTFYRYKGWRLTEFAKSITKDYGSSNKK